MSATSPMLSVEHLTKTFGGLRAVDGLSFELHTGEVVGLLGPNGSGKTTALNLISGALQPNAGSIRFQGHEIAGMQPHRIARLGVARTFQLVRVFSGMTCLENVTAALAFRAKPVSGPAARQEALELLQQVGLRGQHDVPATALTYIDQKRLEMARALGLEPSLLLLDEWLAGLNPTELLEGIALIQAMPKRGITVLLVEHVMDAVRALCDRCVVMNAGQLLADGPTTAALSDPRVVSAYLGAANA